MKADLITLNAVKNYGSVLQAYATQEFFRNKGVDVTLINYIREDILPKNILKANGADNLLKKMVLYPSIIRQKKVFNNFNNKYFNLTSKMYTYEKDFENYNSDADFYITGSDQVWNSTWNKGIIKPLYLSFVNNKPKIAYAASFGKERIDQAEVNETKELIDKYSMISVRENTAVNILKEQYGYKNVERILDPTMIVDKEFWLDFSKNGKVYDNYILVYQLNRNSEFDQYAKKVAKEKKCKLIRICRSYHQILLVGKSVLNPDVETFVSLFANAKLVITDSFHALSFCTNLNIPFICVYPNNFNTRLKSHLELFSLENRNLKSYNDFDIVDKQIDWDFVNQKLYMERKKSIDFVEKALKIIEED